MNNMAANLQLQGAVLTSAVAFGVLGNVPVIVSICCKRSLLKNIYYHLILHLAICDLFFLLFFGHRSLHVLIFSARLGGQDIPCFFTAGENFLVLISILRYRAILHPLKPAVRRRTFEGHLSWNLHIGRHLRRPRRARTSL